MLQCAGNGRRWRAREMKELKNIPEVGVVLVAKECRLISFFWRSSDCFLLLLGHHRRRGARWSAAEKISSWLLVQWRTCRGRLVAWVGEGVVESRGRELQQPHGGCCHCLVCGKLLPRSGSSELRAVCQRNELGEAEREEMEERRGEKDWMG